MKELIDNLKNSLYETEGLAELASNRPEILPRLIPLIEDKLADIKEAFDNIKKSSLDSNPNPEDSEISEEPEYAVVEPEFPDPIASVSASRLPTFCLNDRFRFRRAIFGGSDDDFNAAMNHLATLDSYEEAEDYFLAELGLDISENEDVADFMNIIQNFYTHERTPIHRSNPRG